MLYKRKILSSHAPPSAVYDAADMAPQIIGVSAHLGHTAHMSLSFHSAQAAAHHFLYDRCIDSS